jgi:hypothetical protein
VHNKPSLFGSTPGRTYPEKSFSNFPKLPVCGIVEYLWSAIQRNQLLNKAPTMATA